jgi:sulfur carrier protein
MKVELNGRVLEIAEHATVAELVAETGARPDGRGVAVALDGEVVPRSAWAEIRVAAGQKVEVLEAMQGG